MVQQELGAKKKSSEKTLRGIVGSVGEAKGRVVIVRHAVALKKVREGTIMVALTTHPDYVSAMKKCAAIVTDEGGITSHAAIVARELHIPCLVGTKTATRMFKDGDRVGVDARRGLVTLLA